MEGDIKMVDMSKLKDDALRRKQEHEELERRKQLASMTSSGNNRGAARGRSTNRNVSSSRNLKKTTAQNRSKNLNKRGVKAPKKNMNRWVIDILLVLGALIVVVYFVSQAI